MAQKILCAQYQNVLTYLYNEVSDQKEKLYTSLGKEVEDTNIYGSEEAHYRKKKRTNELRRNWNALFIQNMRRRLHNQGERRYRSN